MKLEIFEMRGSRAAPGLFVVGASGRYNRNKSPHLIPVHLMDLKHPFLLLVSQSTGTAGRAANALTVSRQQYAPYHLDIMSGY